MTPETRAALEAAYADIDQALVDGDVDRAMAWLAPTFTAALPGGASIGREEHETRVRQELAGYDTFGPVHTEIEDLLEGAGCVTATVRRWLLHGSRDTNQTNTLHESFEEERARHRWTVVGGRWLLERSEALGELVWGSVDPEPLCSPRLTRLQADMAAGDTGALDAFWSELAGRAPLVEPVEGDPHLTLVTFIWRSEDSGPVTVGGGQMWTAIDKPLRRLEDSDLWSHTEALPITGRFNYWFQVQERLPGPRKILITKELSDPLNARPSEGTSWFELAGAPAQPYDAERAGAPAGRLIHARIWSATLGEERPYSIYLPHGFRADAVAENRLVVLFDGELYGGGPDTCVPAPRIVDNLVADGRLPAPVVLLVHNLPGRRARELSCSPTFETFVATELVPAVRDRYQAGLRADRVVVGGSSNGGLAAVHCGLRHPDVFGNVLSMSGAFYYTPDWPLASSFPFGGEEGWLMRQFSTSATLPLRFWMTVGRFELAIQVLTNRHLRSVLELKGYPVTYTEFDGGHTYSAWRGSLADGLIALLGEPTGGADGRADRS